MSLQDRSEVLEALNQRAAAHYDQEGVPFVTVTYAQSLDGSIAGSKGEPINISCKESLTYTHALRACHDGILVGVNTILSDDPALSTRLVPGENPRPVVLDSKLRIPSDARVLRNDDQPVVFTTSRSSAKKRAELRSRNICVVEVPANPKGMVSLDYALHCLGKMGIRSLMVEGGGEVITNFLQTRNVDHLIVTISMKMIGGTNVLSNGILSNGHAGTLPVSLALSSVRWEGVDMVVHGDPVWAG